MSTNMNEDRVALEARVKSLHAEMGDYLRASRARATRVGVVMTLLVLIVAGYLSYIYYKLEIVNAETTSQIAYAQTLQYIKDAQPKLSQTLKDKAPAVFDVAEAKLLQSPALVSDYIKRAALDKTQIVLTEAEPRISDVITLALAHAKDATLQAGFDGKDPKQLDAMMAKLTSEIRGQMAAELNRISGQYEQQGTALLTYLDQLGTGKNLDDRQQHVRSVIVSFLAVAEKRKTMP